MRTPFLATRPASPRDYLGAGGVFLLMLGLCGAIAPFASSLAGPNIEVMSGCLVAAVVCQATVAFMLYGQWRAGRHPAIGFLAIGFAFAAAMYAAFWAQYPEMVREQGLFSAAPGRISYFWDAAHVGAFALILAFAATARRVRPADRAVITTATACGGLSVAFFAFYAWKSELLPRLAVNGQFAPVSAHIIHPLVLGFGVLTLVIVVGMTRLRRWIDVFVALYVAGLSFEAYLLSVGPQKYSYGWYASHWELVFATFGIGIPLIREVNVMYRQLAAENRRLARAAMVDPLTGIANRRAFDIQLEHLQTNMVLLIIDIDHFKQYNDLEGHRAGDDCIRRVARALAANVLRSDDLIARYGGDEFGAILHEIDLDDAIHVAERIRLAVEDLAIPAGAEGQKITVSIGVAAYLPGENANDLIRRADEALYRAKEGGRNRVAFDEEVVLQPL